MGNEQNAAGAERPVEPLVGREQACQATPHAALIAQIMDSRVPKNEREHAACREIERLREALQRIFDAAGDQLTDGQHEMTPTEKFAHEVICIATAALTPNDKWTETVRLTYVRAAV